MPEPAAPRQREITCCGTTACAGGVVRTPNVQRLGTPPRGEPDSRFGISRARSWQIRIGGQHRGGGPVFPHRRRDPRTPAFLEQRWPRPTSHVTCPVRVRPCLGHQLALLNHQGRRSSAGRSGITPARSSRRCSNLLGVRPARPSLQESKPTTTPWTRPLQGVGTPKLPRDKMPTTNSP